MGELAIKFCRIKKKIVISHRDSDIPTMNTFKPNNYLLIKLHYE